MDMIHIAPILRILNKPRFKSGVRAICTIKVLVVGKSSSILLEVNTDTIAWLMPHPGLPLHLLRAFPFAGEMGFRSWHIHTRNEPFQPVLIFLFKSACFTIATTKEGISSVWANKHLLEIPSGIFMLCSPKPTKCTDGAAQHGAAWNQECQESLFSAAWQSGKNILQRTVYQSWSLTRSTQRDWETERRKPLHQRPGHPHPSFAMRVEAAHSLEDWLQIPKFLVFKLHEEFTPKSNETLLVKICHFYADVYNELKEIRNGTGVCGVGTGRCSGKEMQLMGYNRRIKPRMEDVVT